MAGIERVDVMIMRRRLRWLGHLERLDDTRIPKRLLVCCPLGGKRSVGGQKMRWCDVIVRDLKRCDLVPDWRDTAHDRDVWRQSVEDGAAELNYFQEEDEEKRKDELKQRREGNGPSLQSQLSKLHCTEPGCDFVGQSRAGLVNHIRQRHDILAQVQLPCPLCDGLFKKQGLHNHIRFCQGKSIQQHRTQ